MTEEEKQAYEWALRQEFNSVAARNARTLARYIKRLKDNISFDQIDIHENVFLSDAARSAGFTRRSFLEAGWRKII